MLTSQRKRGVLTSARRHSKNCGWDASAGVFLLCRRAPSLDQQKCAHGEADFPSHQCHPFPPPRAFTLQRSVICSNVDGDHEQVETKGFNPGGRIIVLCSAVLNIRCKTFGQARTLWRLTECPFFFFFMVSFKTELNLGCHACDTGLKLTKGARLTAFYHRPSVEHIWCHLVALGQVDCRDYNMVPLKVRSMLRLFRQ